MITLTPHMLGKNSEGNKSKGRAYKVSDGNLTWSLSYEDAYAQYARKSDAYLANYIRDFCRFEGEAPQVRSCGQYVPLQDMLLNADASVRDYIATLLDIQSRSTWSTDLASRLRTLSTQVKEGCL